MCSKTRLKILKLLIDSPLTPSEIGRAVGVNYVIAEQHLEILEAEGILSHVKFGKRIRYYKYNEIPRARAVQNLIIHFQRASQNSRKREGNQKKRLWEVVSVVNR